MSGRSPRWFPLALISGAALAAVVAQSPPPPVDTPAQQVPPTTQPARAAAQVTAEPPPATQPAGDAPFVSDAREARLQTPIEARGEMVSGLVGSPHDFTHGGRSGRDLCLPCHTPHLVSPTPPALDKRPFAPQPLRPYQTLGAELNGWSLLCLGCHDGVTASDVYSSGHAVSISAQLGNSRLGTRGLRSHPIGNKYPLAAEDYHPLAEVEAAGLPLPDGRIQCATCHDAHNTHRIPGMLRISNERSRVCLTCHRL